MIKRLKYIFIPVLAVFLMSHNANAIDFTYNLNDYDLVNSYPSGVNYCNITGGANINQGSNANCSFRVQGTTTIKSILFKPNFNIKKGDLLEFYIYLFINGNNSYSPKLYNITLGNNFTTLNFELVMDDDVYSSSVAQGGFINWMPENDLSPGDFIKFRQNFYIYKVSQIALKDLTTPDIGIDVSNSSTGIFQFDENSLGVPVVAQIRNLHVYRYAGSGVNQEQSDATQDASNDSSSAGDSSSSDAESATSSLLSVIGTGIGAITSATPSNCRINGNMGNLDMGSIDLCANPVPTFVAVIGSFIAVALVLPLVIILFNRFISIIRSFQS